MERRRDGTNSPSRRARQRRLAARRSARSARVLVCDCDPAATPPVRDTLAWLGYQVVANHTLSDCLREAAVSPFDAVVLSVPRLPEEKHKLLGLLRRAMPSVPIVVVTSDGSLEMRAACQAVRPYYYAVRPLAEAELREAMTGALARVARAAEPSIRGTDVEPRAPRRSRSN